jgi:hypothetical protein
MDQYNEMKIKLSRIIYYVYIHDTCFIILYNKYKICCSCINSIYIIRTTAEPIISQDFHIADIEIELDLVPYPHLCPL